MKSWKDNANQLKNDEQGLKESCIQLRVNLMNNQNLLAPPVNDSHNMRRSIGGLSEYAPSEMMDPDEPNPQQVEWMAKNQRIMTGVWICILVSLMILSLTSLSMSILAFRQLRNNDFNVKFFEANWNTLPIVDIQVMKASETCPGGYNPLQDWVWPGNVRGCNCKTSSSDEFYGLYPSMCNLN